MAITFQLVEATPDRLMYLCTQDGVISSPPVPADGFATIPNAGGVSPDLRTDAASVGTSGAGGIEVSGVPILAPLRVRLDGYGPIPAGDINQAQARALLNSDDPGNTVIGNQLVMTCTLDIRVRTGSITWAIDANSALAATGNGDPVIEVRSDVGTPSTAYAILFYRVSQDL